MMMMKMQSARFFPVAMVMVSMFMVFTAAPGWGQDAEAKGKWSANYETSLAEAKKSGKDMLLVFTASGLVKICEVFDRDILNQSDFTTPAGEKYELVRLEFTRGNEQSINVRVQNDLLKRAYRVAGYPTVIVTDPEGRPFGMNGYQPVTPAEYAKVMGSMVDTRKFRDEKFAAAEQATGVEKAKLLAEGIPNLPGNLMGRYYGDQMRAVIANDPEDETGVVKGYGRILADVAYAQEMEKLRKEVKLADMLKLTDSYIAEQKLEGVERQRALMNKYAVLREVGDLQGAVATLLEVSKINPQSISGQKAGQILSEMRTKKLQEDLLK